MQRLPNASADHVNAIDWSQLSQTEVIALAHQLNRQPLSVAQTPFMTKLARMVTWRLLQPCPKAGRAHWIWHKVDIKNFDVERHQMLTSINTPEVSYADYKFHLRLNQSGKCAQLDESMSHCVQVYWSLQVQ